MANTRKTHLTDDEVAIVRFLCDRKADVALSELPGWSDLDDEQRVALQNRLVNDLGVAKHYTRGSIVATDKGMSIINETGSPDNEELRSGNMVDNAYSAGLRLESEDIEALRSLRTELYSGGKTFVRREELPGWNKMSRDMQNRMMERLFNNRMVKRPIEGSAARAHLDLVEITDKGMEYLKSVESRNAWASCVKWFFSKWWSVPLIISFGVVTWLIDRFDVLTEIGKWVWLKW